MKISIGRIFNYTKQLLGQLDPIDQLEGIIGTEHHIIRNKGSYYFTDKNWTVLPTAQQQELFEQFKKEIPNLLQPITPGELETEEVEKRETERYTRVTLDKLLGLEESERENVLGYLAANSTVIGYPHRSVTPGGSVVNVIVKTKGGSDYEYLRNLLLPGERTTGTILYLPSVVLVRYLNQQGFGFPSIGELKNETTQKDTVTDTYYSDIERVRLLAQDKEAFDMGTKGNLLGVVSKVNAKIGRERLGREVLSREGDSELLNKIEELEDEFDKVLRLPKHSQLDMDQGVRKLRRLKKEIDALKDKLETKKRLGREGDSVVSPQPIDQEKGTSQTEIAPNQNRADELKRRKEEKRQLKPKYKEEYEEANWSTEIGNTDGEPNRAITELATDRQSSKGKRTRFNRVYEDSYNFNKKIVEE